MKKYSLYAFLVLTPFILAACTKTTNTNSVTIDLVNAANVNTVANTNVSTKIDAATNTNTVATNVNTAVSTAESKVTITAAGFSPATLTVKSGTTVVWANASGAAVLVVSDPHPTHTDLPGLDSASLDNNATYSFTFTQVGSWGYHNHFSSSTRGKVIVE